MYDELIKSLREDHGKQYFARDREAADAIEELQKDLERSNDFEAFWQHEAEEVLKKFQVTISNKPRWIPVTERLPNGEEDVLVTDGDACAVGFYRRDANAWDSCEFGWIENRPEPFPQGLGTVTHWMPLPQTPKEDKE